MVDLKVSCVLLFLTTICTQLPSLADTILNQCNFCPEFQGVMEDIFEQEREDTLSAADKESCQKLLLMVSVKEKIFSKDQRNTAKKLLARLEGDRRRKCRVSEGGRADRRSVDQSEREPSDAGIRKELMIVSSKKKRKRGTPRKSDDGASSKRSPRRESDIDEDGFKLHSDDEADWSDADDGNAKSISLKEAQRRREWGHGKDEMAAAALPWPVFPRHAVSSVLKTLLDEVMKIDEEAGGMFSVPVPKDDFPDYYELIETPVSLRISSCNQLFIPLDDITSFTPRPISDGLWHNAKETRKWRVSISSHNAKRFRADHAELSRCKRSIDA